MRQIYIETHKKEDKSLSPAKKAKLEIAKSLMGVLDIETIALKTGLTEEEIEEEEIEEEEIENFLKE